MTVVNKHNNNYNPWSGRKFAIYSVKVNLKTGAEIEDSLTVEEVTIESNADCFRISHDLAEKTDFSRKFAEQENIETYTRRYLRELYSPEQ